MLAPGVESEIVTLWAEEYVPLGGDNSGVAVGGRVSVAASTTTYRLSGSVRL
jgi:hypothetical protein